MYARDIRIRTYLAQSGCGLGMAEARHARLQRLFKDVERRSPERRGGWEAWRGLKVEPSTFNTQDRTSPQRVFARRAYAGVRRRRSRA